MTTPPVTLDEVRAHLNVTASVDISEFELQMHLDAATEAVENRVGPLVIRDVVERSVSWGRVALRLRPAVSITSVSTVLAGAVNPVAGDTSTLTLDSGSGVLDLTGRVANGSTVEVAYRAGRGTVDQIEGRFKLAVLIVTKHLWETQRGQGARGSRWGTQDAGGDDMAEILRGFALPRRALELIGYDEDVAIG